MEILKHLARMRSVLGTGEGRAWNAALITPASQRAGKPSVGDAMEVFKKLARMPSLLNQ